MDLKELSKRHNAIILLCIIIAISVTIYIAYQELFYSYVSLLLTENYSYLIVVIPIVSWVFVKLTLAEFTVEGISILRAIASIMSFSVALTMYTLGDSIPSLYVELKMLSLVFLLWSFIVLFFRSRRRTIGFLAMFSLFLLVPIPREVLDLVSLVFTKVIARAVRVLTNVPVVELNGITTLVVKDINGIDRFFELAPVCSGVVSLLSVISILPAILYIASKSMSSFKRKTVYTILSILAALVIVFVGNILRIVAMILATKFVGFDVALAFFHYTPSVIYVAIASAVSIYTISRLPREYVNKVATSYRTKLFVKTSVGLAISIVMLIMLTTLFNVLAPQSSIHIVAQKTPYTISLPVFLQNPTHFLFNTSRTFILRDVPEPRLSLALGIPIVRSITLMHNNTLFLGYVEIADIPTRFHGWYVCLTAQGYVIEKSWSEVGNVTVNNIIAYKSGTRILLSYAIYNYVTAEGTSYVRVSLITPIADDYSNQLQLARILLNDAKLVNPPRPWVFTLLDISVILVNTSFALGLVLVFLHLIGGKAYRKFIVKLGEAVK